MTSVRDALQPPVPHVVSTPSSVGAGLTVESQPVPAPFVSWSIAYVLPSGPVMVRVLPLAPLVRVSSQPAACFSMKAWVSSHLEP
jgi:hypothetical protein